MLNLTHPTTTIVNVARISTTRTMPLGVGQNYIVSGGRLEGKLNRKVLPGGDFPLAGPSGIGHVEAINSGPGALKPQLFPRAIGRVLGHNLSNNPFLMCPSYQALQNLSLTERLLSYESPRSVLVS